MADFETDAQFWHFLLFPHFVIEGMNYVSIFRLFCVFLWARGLLVWGNHLLGSDF